ncbi:uncharacterized protein LOC120277431 [Dioscorea cayenensis subsp. rotundata]|uniref:Uncharacterized protein LOC120277431 n=1 Tax=Dioscorea cayennensis subsp. rotundata TaxID=55577 RepID=A0AB40CLH0_DIOCR|nr:uncharacterized protein LOC120277431 [Dioscorea cayenensis subsp. rotundata]
MEAIYSSPIGHPIHSFLGNYPTQSRQACTLFLVKQRHQHVYSKYSLHTPAINDGLIIAATSKAPGGDISVLLPISALLLFMYFISNFVVPSFIMKDLGTAVEEENPEEINSSETPRRSRHGWQTKTED